MSSTKEEGNCKVCLRSCWTEKPTKECPVGKRRSSRSDPPSELTFKNLCENFFEQSKQKTLDEDVCKVHSEKLKLFCLTEQQSVCVVCRDSAAHRNHQFKPIDEAAKDLREKMQKSIKPLKDKLERINEVKKELEEAVDHIGNQSRQTERQIQDQFKKLHQFLLEEEEARMKALREEEELKTQRMKDKMASVSREIEALSETIRVTEEQLRAADVCFLLKYKTAVERVQRCPLLEETQLGPGALIDQAKHLGNLLFNIWTNMKRLVQYTPVILNPNTAGHHLILSDDLTSFSCLPSETLEKNMTVVFGSAGFVSGSHSWDVDVGDNEDWALGVVNDPFEAEVKKEYFEAWTLSFSSDEYQVAVSYGQMSVNLDSTLRKIRIHLDCDEHKLSFKDAETYDHVHSISNFHYKKLFPIFYTTSKSPITILPQEI